MISFHLKTDAENFRLLKTGQKPFLIQYDTESEIKVGDILTYTDIADNRSYPDQFRGQVTCISTEHVALGYRALGFIDIDNGSETDLMSKGSLTASQRANLKRDPWVDIGLDSPNQKNLGYANGYKKNIRELKSPKCRLVESRKLGDIQYFTEQLIKLFDDEKTAIEFLER